MLSFIINQKAQRSRQKDGGELGALGSVSCCFFQPLPKPRLILVNVKRGSDQRSRNRTSRLRASADAWKTSFLIFHCFTREATLLR